MTGRVTVHVRTAVVAALVAALALGGCGGGVEPLAFPTPPPTRATPTTSVPPPVDYSGVSQPSVPGSTTTTLPAIGPGAATIDGTVIGPSGPVAGATVEAQRIVGGATTMTQATSAADGSFSIPRVLGGIYRVRAWQAPQLALTTPDVFFLGATQLQALTLTLQSYSTLQLSSSMAPNPVQEGGDANLVVSVTQQVVGTDGIVRASPVAGQALDIDGGTAWTVTSTNPTTTDAAGEAAFALTCTAAPAPPLVATVTGQVSTLTTSSCVVPPPPTTSPSTSTTTGTTLPGVAPPASSTTTTPVTPPSS